MTESVLSTNTPLKFPSFCEALCYEVVNDTFTQIRQLKVECDDHDENGTISTSTEDDEHINVDILAADILDSYKYWNAVKLYLSNDLRFYPGSRYHSFKLYRFR